jgi:hypothetical protein
VFRAPGLAVTLLLVYPLYWLWISLGLLLDRAFFRKAPNGETIVIAGPPRSGSTFLQRYLAENTSAQPTLLWEAFIPSLCWQRMLRPAIRRARRRDLARIDLGAAHITGLEFAETDDLQVFARHLDSFFYYVYCLSWHNEEFPEYINAGMRPAEVASRDLRWLRRAARRNRINGPSRQALLKSFSVGFALGAAQAELSQPRLIYLSRAPHEALPSSLSMARNVLQRAGLYSRTSDLDRRRHADRLIRASLALQRAAIADLRRMPEETVLVVRYEDLVGDFATTMRRVLRFTGAQFGGNLAIALNAKSEQQRNRLSAHVYSLADFGLNEESVREQFAEIYDYFGHQAIGQ